MRVLQDFSTLGVGKGRTAMHFYIGQTSRQGLAHGLVNVAAFLAHAMAVSIRFDVCDEFNVDKTGMFGQFLLFKDLNLTCTLAAKTIRTSLR